jgi:hypothetical protein
METKLHIILNKNEVRALMRLNHKNHLKVAKELKKICEEYLKHG